MTFWQHKPWWCQPWTILLTGSLGIALDGLLYVHFSTPLWLALPWLLLILAWWFLFLVLVPSAANPDDLH
ncbi:MAG: DUF6737 family protein [Cyanobacteriota bacterium]|nr:DUF6737 family protein [Cyanobacteriota bacterium]